MTEKKLKLYVWEGVLYDYNSGIMFALAESVEQARQVILDSGGNGLPTVEQDIKREPKVYDKPYGKFLFGSG